MSFLAPLFLLGALALAFPVLFHLIRRTTRERTIFSSLLFLLPTPPRLTRRSKLEHILLLLLRCAVLGLLAVGFARPFIKRPVTNTPASAARRILVLLDTSASMRRANLWSSACDKVESVVRQATPADQVAVFTFDRDVKPLLTFDEWNTTLSGERLGLARRKLAATAPGWSATRLGEALITAAETLADTKDKPDAASGKIVAVSDLQEGSRLEPLQGYEWPKGLELSVEPVQTRRVSNASLQLVTDVEESDPKANAGVRVQVGNAPDSRREQFQVGWARADRPGFVGAPVNAYVPPGQSRTVVVPLPAAEGGLDRIVLQGDEEVFDNTVFVTPPETLRLRVLYFGAESAADTRQPLYFLERAFQETRRQAVQVLARAPVAPISPTEAQAATLLISSDGLPEERARALHDEVAAGKTLLCVLKSAAAAPTLASLLGINGLNLEEVRPNNYAMLGEIDFRHPLFAPFADPRFSDFTKIHFWKYRRLDPATVPGAHVIARFDSGDPAVLDVPLAKGRVLVLTSGWHPEDSQLALSTKFVPLLYSLLEQSGAPSPTPVQYHVGDAVPLAPAAGEGGSPASVRAPDGSQIALVAGETNFSQTLVPGIYTLGSAQPPRKFAVNLDPRESRLRPLPVEELERLGAPVAKSAAAVAREAERKARLQDAELESRQKLWRWFIAAALAVLLFETWLAGRTARGAAAQPEAAAESVDRRINSIGQTGQTGRTGRTGQTAQIA